MTPRQVETRSLNCFFFKKEVYEKVRDLPKELGIHGPGECEHTEIKHSWCKLDWLNLKCVCCFYKVTLFQFSQSDPFLGRRH